uniref:Uncharacterized protein n=1 Tax=viral metagenome TaxID=1070528 RepID=A0A6C0IB35_9ZZZZ
MKIEVSVGEVIDKLSILELKLEKIKQESKLKEIQKELNELQDICSIYKSNYYYHILKHINEEIWENTDRIKSLKVDNDEFSVIANCIFELNQKRFRIKNIFNMLYQSELNEQKSYAELCCRVIINDNEEIYRKLPEINHLILTYDIVFFEEKFCEKIKQLIHSPLIRFDDTFEISNIIHINKYIITETDKKTYEYTPLIYSSGGLLGDFIHQLSVINEKYLETGKKGILYISPHVEFRFGIQQTYQDTYEMVINQEYILEYKIYNNESVDYNLSSWRTHPIMKTNANWYHIFKHTYNIEWGTHPWLKPLCTSDKSYDYLNNTVLINTTPTRGIEIINVNFKQLYETYGSSIMFITNNVNHYEQFKQTCDIDIQLLYVESLYDTLNMIANCKLFIGGLSAYLTLAHALHTVNHMVGRSTITNSEDYSKITLLDTYIPTIRYTLN